MFGLFRKRLVEPETMAWMLDHAEWLLADHVHAKGFADARLVLPKEGFFVTDGEKGHALAKRLMTEIQLYAGVPDLSVKLSADPRSGRFRQTGMINVQQKADAAGLYWGGDDGGVVEISYDAEYLKTPGDLIAILSHELAHAVLDMGAARPPPSDEDVHEFLTDFTAVLLGFGVFSAYFRAETRVWTREGAEEWKDLYVNYMNFNEIAAATTLFVLLHGIAPDHAIRNARDDFAAQLKTGFRNWADHRGRIDRLKRLVADKRGV